MEYKSMRELNLDYIKKSQAIRDQFPYDEEVLRKDQLMNAPLEALQKEMIAAIEAFKSASERDDFSERMAALHAQRAAKNAA